LTIEYALLRYTGLSGPDGFEAHLEGEWVVQPGTQTISLGYVYPSDGASMPDTALPVPVRSLPPSPAPPISGIVGALSLAVALTAFERRLSRCARRTNAGAS